MLARMGALLDLEARPARSPILKDLNDLHMAREALVKNRKAAKNRAKTLILPILERHNAEQLRQIERQITAIEKEIVALITADQELARRFDILVSIPGVSAITAFALIIDMPELGTLGKGQAASLAGLAPITRQYGQWTGRAFVRGGWANIRQALYMPALVAMRFNTDFKAKYDHLITAGKSAKKAITGHHAKARRARKRPAQGRPQMGSIPSVTNTDTLGFDPVDQLPGHVSDWNRRDCGKILEQILCFRLIAHVAQCDGQEEVDGVARLSCVEDAYRAARITLCHSHQRSTQGAYLRSRTRTRKSGEDIIRRFDLAAREPQHSNRRKQTRLVARQQFRHQPDPGSIHRRMRPDPMSGILASLLGMMVSKDTSFAMRGRAERGAPRGQASGGYGSC